MEIDHNVEQSTFGYKAYAQNMYGWLEVSADTDAANQLCNDDPSAVHPYNSGDVFGFNGTGGSTDHSPCWISPKRNLNQLDYFDLKTLLIAAGVDLDDIQGSLCCSCIEHSFGACTASGGYTARYRGLKVVVFIEYSNSHPFQGTHLMRLTDADKLWPRDCIWR